MCFDGFFGLENFNHPSYSLITRQAVRAVIFRDHKILMIRSDKGGYKLPGGGIEAGESHEKALLRELLEETGYTGSLVKKRIGIVTERYPDAFEADTYFQMFSYYYQCDLVHFEQAPLMLSAQEREQNFLPVWVHLDEAIRSNKELLLQNKANRWIQRENYVLEELNKKARK